MTYSNPMSSKLGLLDDDLKMEGKLIRLCKDLETKILTPVPYSDWQWHVQRADVTADQALKADWSKWEKFGPHSVWAKKQGHTWFAAEVIVPEEARGKTFVLKFTSQWQDRPGSTDPQCLAYLDGKIAQALDGNHTELVIERKAKPGNKHVLLVNAFTFFDRPLVGFTVDFYTRSERAEKLYWDLQTPLDVAVRLYQNDPRRQAILNIVDRALRALDRRDGFTPEFEASLGAAEKIAGEIYKLVDTEVQPQITAVGSTHLDVGWLWRVMHTRDKTGRSFATVLNLMEEYPEFIFMYNQSVLFDFLKKDYPELWDRMIKKIKAGQFEIEGAMWVEPDVNIVSGESLVRQIMRGRRFHLEHFGVDPKTVWLPDTFGYSANLPQVMDKSGLKYFVTSKLSWNDTDRHPYDSFHWKGIDGTVTKAQLITAQKYDSEEIFTTYNGDLSVSETMGAWKRYEPKAVHSEVVMSYGYGDGGGGPTRGMIERGIRMERGIPGAPKVKLEGIVPFLDRLGKAMDAPGNRFPTWNGELYLQYHRGTLTSVAKNKANNRRAERMLRELEFLGAMALTQTGAAYPSETLAEFWELVLINQFHDILPGTSIPEVYVDSDNEYGQIFSTLGSQNGPWHSAAQAFAKPGADQLRLFNFTGQTRSGLVSVTSDGVQEGTSLATNGAVQPLQKLISADGTTSFGAPAADIAPLGWTGGQIVSGAAKVSSSLSVSEKHLENDKLRITFDKSGEITSILDKTRNRETLAQGEKANRLIAYEDKPMEWDAWDIDRYFEEQFWPLADGKTSISVVETGPHRAAIRVERKYQASTVVQVISLEVGARQVEFDTFIDWQERRTVLKAQFPFDLNTSEIRSEIQFGHVKRPTHRNTSWDKARFEASMHRWVDLSEADFGVALLNDCKYAYDCLEQSVRLTLVRGSTHPDPLADLGEHRLRYALFVHDGVADLAEVHRAAERFNNPVALVGSTRPSGSPASEFRSFSFASADQSNVTLETVKKAEKSDAVVLRIFEHANIRADATISFGVPVKSVRVVNLMEEGDSKPLELKDNTVSLALRPFEIATLLIET
ncbi:MAG: glycoside hydrolase family 38 C-terminal domain-containing protein [Candidatus Devosia phytovorans]|uniref:Glycoside hydrolase family 38 C-terminal domain-containing protein n=1 Tax=Candidatus Devosia phytovorans TaxID=3121372 RepID=A0AAJ6B0U0_9HYPH|nr:glycoside hydrolase family 38 C-terminal domain-containing protein [Devosia sp.]WEK03848.1 MAG: glycoside hydrolase family 38 C-terminal domain-containing protein [Devosia sp.]